jgi:hypothetical protein
MYWAEQGVWFQAGNKLTRHVSTSASSARRTCIGWTQALLTCPF